MPQKNSLFTNKPVISGQAMATSFISPIMSVQFLDNLMIQIVSTGTPTGSFAIQGSNDYNKDVSPLTVNWINLPLSGTPTLSGSPDSIDIQMTQLASPFIRVVYTATSGAGSCSIWLAGKEI